VLPPVDQYRSHRFLALTISLIFFFLVDLLTQPLRLHRSSVPTSFPFPRFVPRPIRHHRFDVWLQCLCLVAASAIKELDLVSAVCRLRSMVLSVGSSAHSSSSGRSRAASLAASSCLERSLSRLFSDWIRVLDRPRSPPQRRSSPRLEL